MRDKAGQNIDQMVQDLKLGVSIYSNFFLTTTKIVVACNFDHLIKPIYNIAKSHRVTDYKSFFR